MYDIFVVHQWCRSLEKPMKAAPGAQLPIKDIFGRDPFIASLWRVLDGNSVRMEAERRIGKTSILHKMEAEPHAGWEPVSLDLEKVHSAAEFAEQVCEKVHERLTGWKKHGRRFLSILGYLSDTTIGPIKFPDKKDQQDGYWKKLLTGAVEDLVEQQAAVGKRVVFFFDEMPWMLAAIADPKREGEQTAMEVLDVLRALRQATTTGHGFRMVLCGSIGLHHVLESLEQQGYKNRPVNDMRLVQVPPLDIPVATELAARLLTGEGLTGDPTAPGIIAEQTGGFPYYIHWVVSELQMGGRPATPGDIDLVVKTLLTASYDPCDLRHFKKRIGGYYPKEEKVVLALLDHAAKNIAPLGQAELINVAKTAGATDEDRVRELLDLLAVDHYLNRDTDGRYNFRHALLRRWWLLERGLK
jgi:hypothetical protein